MQKINNIEIKNFKSIRQTEIKDCRKVNVFVGPPNVGKSNILEALGLFGFNEDKKLQELFRVKEETTLFFNGEIEQDFYILINEKLEIKGSYSDNHLYFNYNYYEQDRDKKAENAQSSNFKEYKFSNFNLIDFINTGTDIDRKRGYFFEKDFSVKKYEFIKNFKKTNGKYSTLIYPNGNNIFSVISAKENIYKEIFSLFKIYNLELLFDSRKFEYSILRRTKKGIFTLPYELIADTLQRLIFYKTAVMSNKSSTLLFEEPEANCYEPYIMEITNAIKNDENDNQFFIVTHSQYVVDELMRDREYRDNVNIYLVGLNDNNETEVKLLKQEVSEENYKTGLNIFFNYESLWNEN